MIHFCVKLNYRSVVHRTELLLSTCVFIRVFVIIRRNVPMSLPVALFGVELALVLVLLGPVRVAQIMGTTVALDSSFVLAFPGLVQALATIRTGAAAVRQTCGRCREKRGFDRRCVMSYTLYRTFVFLGGGHPLGGAFTSG